MNKSFDLNVQTQKIYSLRIYFKTLLKLYNSIEIFMYILYISLTQYFIDVTKALVTNGLKPLKKKNK